MALILQSLMDPSRNLLACGLEGQAFSNALPKLFGFAYVWALGGNLAPSCRDAFDVFVRKQLADIVTFPGNFECNRCFDCCSKRMFTTT